MMTATLEEAEQGVAQCSPQGVAQGAQGVAPVVQGIPIRAAPGVLGAAQAPESQASTASMLLDVDEQTVLNYQAAVSCFAVFDLMTTMLNALAAYAQGLQWNNLQLLGLLLLIGPLCGILGASYLNRHLVGIFVVFSVIKATMQIYVAVATFLLWTLIFAFVQCWITKIAATFWWVLGKLTPERRRQVLEAKDYEVQKVYF